MTDFLFVDNVCGRHKAAADLPTVTPPIANLRPDLRSRLMPIEATLSSPLLWGAPCRAIETPPARAGHIQTGALSRSHPRLGGAGTSLEHDHWRSNPGGARPKGARSVLPTLYSISMFADGGTLKAMVWRSRYPNGNKPPMQRSSRYERPD